MRLFVCIFILASVVLSGCSQVVRVSHSANKLAPAGDNLSGAIPQGIATKVAIHPLAERQQRQHSETGLIVVGLVNNWDIDANSALPDAVRTLFAQHYENVVVANECDDCGLIVHPEVTHIDIQSVTMQASVGIELRVYDANFKLITTLHGQGSSSFMSATRLGTGVAGYFIPFLGTAVGSFVVQGTVQAALENAMIDANDKLAAEANGGALARTWLPKTHLRKKQHGNHEYTAEMVAKSAGCDMSSDGIKLTSQQYFKETYSAHCWGKPSFAISCEFGRCTLADTPEIAQTNNGIQ